MVKIGENIEIKYEEEIWKKVISECDFDNDGKISYEEYKKAIQS